MKKKIIFKIILVTLLTSILCLGCGPSDGDGPDGGSAKAATPKNIEFVEEVKVDGGKCMKYYDKQSCAFIYITYDNLNKKLSAPSVIK